MKVRGPIVPPGWRCCPLPAAIALPSAPGARRLEIEGALVAAALASKMAGSYPIQAMESGGCAGCL